MMGAVLATIITGLILLSVLGFSIQGTMRAYVHGEALWSRAQKTATYHLTRYGLQRDSADYTAFLAALAIPRADRRAREELERAEPDLAAARQALLEGGNHAHDVPGLIRFFRRFRRLSFVDSAITVWAEGDSLIARLEAAGAALRSAVTAPRADEARIAMLLGDIDALDARLTAVEHAFSDVMSAGARWAGRAGSAMVVAGGLLMLGVTAVVIRAAARRMLAFETAARSSDARYQALVETAADGIIMMDADSVIRFVNPGATRIFGYPADALVGRPITMLMPEAFRQRHLASLAEYVTTGRRHISWEAVQLAGLRQDGAEIPIELSFAELRRGGDHFFIGIVRDVSERRHLEAQLRQAQKMEAIGQLTGGIAHDFNNILTVVLTSTELLEREVGAPAAGVRDELDQIRKAALRAKEMTRKLLAFSRTGHLQLHRMDLGAAARDAAILLRRIVPARVTVHCVVGDPPAIRGDAGAIEQIILNLATNARDAMPAGGSLTLDTDRTRLDDDDPAPEWYARLTIRDTGTGMTAAVRERAFEPFFTTKPPGAGTGLGLAMVYGLMQQHGGLVEVESTPGQGTAVHLLFPATAESTSAAPSPPAGAPPRGSETVLVVDDEPAICRATRRLLEAYGYTVLTAPDGTEGLRVFDANRDRIGLVLSDVVMPGLDGRALYDAVRATGAQVPFLFMSGYTGPPEGGEGSLIDPDLPLLHKPWTAGELLHHVRAVLDAAAGRENG
jgi:PAS domain S-box-containing protein